MNSRRIRSSFGLRNFDPNMPILDVNERFVEACATGDYQTVNAILDSIKDFNIDVTDNLGRTALRLAVANENIEVVQALLSKADSPRMREALLLAIYMGHTQIAESILRHPQYKIFNDKKFLNNATDSFWQTPSSDDAQFSPDITPIMLASQYNRTEIVQMLLLNGDRIEKPHDFHCKCNECGNRFKFDSLRHAQSRLNAYRGLASESYISLASIDPILTAFELAFELRILSVKEKYFKSDYSELAEMLSEYSVKLLNNVRGRDELEIVLNKVGKENEEKFKRLSRLDLAIKYQEMPFVAHPNCQQKLVEIWNTGIRKVIKMNELIILLLLICFILFIPVGSLIYIFSPHSKLGKFMCLPCIKFISFTVSYFTFIGLIIASTVLFRVEESEKFSDAFHVFYENYTKYHENHELKYRFETNNFYLRNNKPNFLDICICVWLLGLLLSEIKKNIVYGVKDYLSSWSNIFTQIMTVLFIASYGLKYYTIIKVESEKELVGNEEFWYIVENLTESNIEDQMYVYERFYWLNADRFYWFSLDPINLSECLYSVAIIFSFFRLCFWLPANQNIGPLQIILGRMITDVLKFICIFTIVFSGFLFGLHNLFWYYQEDVRKFVEVEPHEYEILGGKHFGTVGSALITMFFSLYALGASDDTDIDPYENKLTPNIGFALFGIFHIVNIVIMFSMLIAMLTKSFEAILEHSDTEWKFSRSRLYMEFIKEGSTLPIPINIIPTPSSIYFVFKKIFCFFKKEELTNISKNENSLSHMDMPNGKMGNGNIANGHAGGKKSTNSSELTYKKVMERVAKRFLLHNNRENEEVKESDFDELKQDVQMARFEMLSDMRRSRENIIRYSSILHKGISLIGERFFNNEEIQSEFIKKYKQFKTSEGVFKRDFDDLINPKFKINLQNNQDADSKSISNDTKSIK